MATSEILNNKFVIALNSEIANAIYEQMDRDKVASETNIIYDNEKVFIDTITVDGHELPVGMNIDMEVRVENVQFDEECVEDWTTKLWYGDFEIEKGYQNDFNMIEEVIKVQTGMTIDELLKMCETQESIINDYNLNEEIGEVLEETAEPDEITFDDDYENGWKF